VTVTPHKTPLAGPTRPLGSPEVPQFHLPIAGPGELYTPRVYGAARIHFADRRRHLDETRRLAVVVAIEAGARTLDWDKATPTAVMPEDLVADAPMRASYLPLPASAMDVQRFARWAKSFDRWLARTQRIERTTSQAPPETVTLGPKRGGVSVELVALVWELGSLI
jgi:hypothetical protein